MAFNPLVAKLQCWGEAGRQLLLTLLLNAKAKTRTKSQTCHWRENSSLLFPEVKPFKVRGWVQLSANASEPASSWSTGRAWQQRVPPSTEGRKPSLCHREPLWPEEKGNFINQQNGSQKCLGLYADRRSDCNELTHVVLTPTPTLYTYWARLESDLSACGILALLFSWKYHIGRHWFAHIWL